MVKILGIKNKMEHIIYLQSFLSISSFEPESMGKQFNLPPSHLSTSLAQFYYSKIKKDIFFLTLFLYVYYLLKLERKHCTYITKNTKLFSFFFSQQTHLH